MFAWDRRPSQSIAIAPSSVMFVVAFLFGLYFLYLIRFILVLLFLAVIVMVALNPLVTRLQQRFKLPRALCAALVYLIVIVGFAGAVGIIVPPIVRQMYELIRALDVPIWQDQVQTLNFTVTELSALAERVTSSFGVFLSIVVSTFNGVFTTVSVIVMSFYLMLDRPYLHYKIGWFTREKKHWLMAEQFLNTVESQLGGWVRGQVILMSVIGFITYVGLSLLGIPFALPLAFVAGMLEILPNMGPTIAAIPAVILAYIGLGPGMAGVTVLFYIIVQQFENNVIVPKIMKENADVNPLVAILAILVGFELGGVMGALLSVPSYIVVRAAYSLWVRQNN